MKRRRALLASIGLLVASFAAAPHYTAQTAQTTQATVSFERDIQPLLAGNCWKCHSDAMQLSKLNLSTRENAMKGGSTGAAIVAGHAEDSKLYRMVAGLDKPQMPMGGKLTDAQIALVKAWIDQGAPWEGAAPVLTKADKSPFADLENAKLPPNARDYWAFKLPLQGPVPSVSTTSQNPIDQFLQKTRQDMGLKTAPKADRLTLLRRAHLDLIGLPPTPAEIDAFMADTAPGAWEREIDKLLASPHYGERWGRHWLDVARYGDSGGFQNDTDRPYFWRYRDYVIDSFNQDKPYNLFIKEQVAGDEFQNRTDENLIATGFLRAGPRVQHREKDNPERRHDYLDDVLGTIGKGVLGVTLQCARCHDHKFDPILQKDYYAMQASIYGYVEVDYPLGPREAADTYMRTTFEIADKVAALKDQIEKIEAPYQQELALVQIRKKYPENVVKAVETPESERTPGEKLLATQVLESAITISTSAIDKIMTPEDAAKKKALSTQVTALNSQKPKTPAKMAHITTDGDWRATGAGTGDGTKGACPVCELEYRGARKFLELGPGKGEYETPPSYFLVRGEPGSKAYATKPGFLSVITYGNPPTELPPADGRTSGRRLALAEWLVSRDNPLTARVIVNRMWHHHFGRGIVATLDNFGKMGEQPTHQDLLDWLAVEFMNRGWSLKQMHKMMMTSEAYQMASEFNDAASAAKDPDDKYLWKYRINRLEGEIIRDGVMATAGTLDLTMGGPPIFPFVPQELLDSIERGVWRNQKDGPAVWRRSVYIYAKRSLPFPMVHVFDLADLNVSFGARNVSTVPTQALTLMNNAFMLRQAQLFADRLKKEAGEDVEKQVDLAYKLALTRSPTAKELAVAKDVIGTGSLVDFTDVMLNLSEFVYTR